MGFYLYANDMMAFLHFILMTQEDGSKLQSIHSGRELTVNVSIPLFRSLNYTIEIEIVLYAY